MKQTKTDIQVADWDVCDGDLLLIRLRYQERQDNWAMYRPEFFGASPKSLEEALAHDPRDVSWLLVNKADGASIPFCQFLISFQPNAPAVSLKYVGLYTVNVPKWWLDPSGRAEPGESAVPLQRAPLGWKRLNEIELQKELLSGEKERERDALREIGYHSSAKQSPWASRLLLERVLHSDVSVRLTAVSGLGELARIHGYIEPSTVTILTTAVNDPSRGVRSAAAEALDVIARFIDPVKS